jgi:hypothetical protein
MTRSMRAVAAAWALLLAACTGGSDGPTERRDPMQGGEMTATVNLLPIHTARLGTSADDPIWGLLLGNGFLVATIDGRLSTPLGARPSEGSTMLDADGEVVVAIPVDGDA